VKECAYCRRRAIGTGKPAPAEVRVRESQRSPPLVKNVSLGVGVTSFVQTMSP